MSEQAKEIINKYCDSKRKFLFPILDNKSRTATQIKDRIYDVLANVNHHLNEIGKSLGIELKITTYVARHHLLSYSLKISSLYEYLYKIGNDLETSKVL